MLPDSSRPGSLKNSKNVKDSTMGRSLIPVLFMLLFLSSTMSAREEKNLMKANFYYAHCAYYMAIPYFEK